VALTIFAIPVAAGVASAATSKITLKVKVCFEFVSGDTGFPDLLKNWPSVVSKERLSVSVFDAAAPEKAIATGVWPGIADMTHATDLWSQIVSDPTEQPTMWIATEKASAKVQVRTYSVRHVLQALKKRQTAKLLARKNMKIGQSLTLTGEESKAMADFWAYHAVPKEGQQEARVTGTTKLSVSDFALMATQHPELGRAVGLIAEISISAPIDMVKGKALLLRAAVVDDFIETPFSACTVVAKQKGTFFVPSPAQGDESYLGRQGGLLRMRDMKSGTSFFYLETMDYVASWHREEAVASAEKSANDSHREAVAGLAIVTDDLTPTPDKLKQEAIKLSGSKPAYILYAAALLRGYDIDVLHNGKWFQQCSRRVDYKSGQLEWEEKNEGFVNPNPIIHDGNGPQQHQEVARMTIDGSFVAPCPGKLADGTDPVPGKIGKISFNARMPQSGLVAVRDGREYSIRIRPVFVGACCVGFEDAAELAGTDQEALSESHRFRRSQFVNCPVVVTDPKHPGLCNELGNAQNHTREFRLLCSSDVPNVGTVVRYVHPPSLTEEELILTGELDAKDPESAYDLLTKFAALSPNPKSPRDPRGIPDPDAVGASFVFLLQGENAAAADVKCSEDLKTVELLPNCPTESVFSFYGEKGSWPNIKPIRLEVHAIGQGPSQIKIDRHNSVLSVSLSPGATVQCRVSSVPRTSDFNQIVEDSSQPALSSLKDRYVVPNGLLLKGLEDKFLSSLSAVDVGAAASVTLMLKHAARDPLFAPRWSSPVVMRNLGARSVVVRDTPVFDQNTTGKLWLKLGWDELSCSKSGNGIVVEKKAGTSEEVQVGNEAETTTGGHHATSSIRDFNVVFSDTKARDIKTRIVAEGQYRECFGLAASGTKSKESAERSLLIPNCAVPSTPAIKFILPLTAIKREKENFSSGSVRKGNAVRVYLDGCWCETGRGEMLGVVCSPESQEGLDDIERRKNEPFFSQWGAEVLLKTTALGDGPFGHFFTSAQLLFDGVNSISLEEAKQGLKAKRAAIVAGHAVRYDERRQCWYADIHLPTAAKSFLPWLRMGLVRFQPDSIPGCHISPVVLASFCQLLPNRTITAVRSSVDSRRLIISVAGIGPTSQSESTDFVRSVLEVKALIPLDRQKDDIKEVFVDDDGRFWLSQASAVLQWEADKYGNGSYSGEMWVTKSMAGKTRVLLRESLQSVSQRPQLGGRPILLDGFVL